MKKKAVFVVVILLSIACTLIGCMSCNSKPSNQGSTQEQADPSLLDHYDQIGPNHPVSENGWHIHDPSRIVEINGYLMTAVSGKENADGYRCGLETWYLAPGETEWTPGQCLLIEKPNWVSDKLPTNDGAYWAPSFLSPRVMYYSVSAGFDEVENAGACIGMLTATGTAPNLKWTDSGSPIVASFNAEANADPEPQAIDPCVFIDDDGSQYLIYGGGHIWATSLDPATGRQINDGLWSKDDPNYYHLANGPLVNEDGEPVEDGEEEWIEAPFLYKYDGYYYLFVNWYACCNGVESTYEIRVGRSTSPTGPFTDREGVDMRNGGGTLFLDRHGSILGNDKYIGPGHAGIHEHSDGRFCFSFHYYDGTDNGIPKLGLAGLQFIDGWPEVIKARFDFCSVSN